MTATKLAIHGGRAAVSTPRPRYPVLGEEERSAVLAVLASGDLSIANRSGPIAVLEDELASTFGSSFALSFASGTAAIHSALWAIGVRPGDRVITSGYTWLSAITAIHQAGATPVFCDVEPNSVNLNPGLIPNLITAGVTAVIVTHMWGIPARIEEICEVAEAHGVPVLEDCSHAHGARVRGRRLGTFGRVGCFSLQNSKPIVSGEGGFLLTNDHDVLCSSLVLGHPGPRLQEELARTDIGVAPSLVDRLAPLAHASPSYKYRMSPLAAAVAIEQLRKLDALNKIRQENLNVLEEHSSARTRAHMPKIDVGSAEERGWHAVPALLDDGLDVAPELIRSALQAEGVSLVGDYADWTRTPIVADPKVRSQFWTTPPADGQAAPVPVLPATDALRHRVVLLDIPSVLAPEYMQETAAGLNKVFEAAEDRLLT